MTKYAQLPKNKAKGDLSLLALAEKPSGQNKCTESAIQQSTNVAHCRLSVCKRQKLITPHYNS